MKVIDSSVWLELVTDGPLAEPCSRHLADLAEVVTPTVVLADLSIEHGLAAVDAVIYATARLEGCELVTADTDFRGLPGVTLVEADA